MFMMEDRSVSFLKLLDIISRHGLKFSVYYDSFKQYTVYTFMQYLSYSMNHWDYDDRYFYQFFINNEELVKMDEEALCGLIIERLERDLKSEGLWKEEE